VATSDDFGYSAIKWEEANAANVRLVEAEYRERLTGAIAAWNDQDGKARFLFSGLVGLVTAIVGWTLSQLQNLGFESQVGLCSLAALLFCAAMFVACAILPRPYPYLGVTPADLDVSKWSPLLQGDDKQALRLSGVRIAQYAKDIVETERSNHSKGKWMAWSVRLTLAALPLSVLFALAATATPAVLLNAARAPVASPIGILIAAAALILGIVIGRLLRTG
jgi:hypothetical protein